ncbi:LOW QUALITY PROTEIN: uncharacterized protein LOC117326838 [Pecten maximus]|uniref:LOW QUALITY PROTEIN: uncharacterized protein LOC117326838 n=1 Tax=Pecten maximus TaxID=6579 RepID=UPI0014581A39|nr:LOW QUALITY PROTEIN: uncharacterized protein LOC117326838 [Pecten maximus]
MDFGVWIPLTEDQADEVGDDITCRSLSSARESTMDVRAPTPHVGAKSMENDYEVPLHRLRCLRGLGKAGFIPTEPKFKDVTIRYIPKPKFRWAVESYVKQGVDQHPSRKQVPFFLRRSKTLQVIQNKPFQRFYTKLEMTPTPRALTDRDRFEPFSRKNKNDRRYSLSFVYKQTPYPGILQKPKTDRPLLRRPTPLRTPPVQETDSQFKHFTKSLELKPKNFATSTEQDIFYNRNYPLLLDAHPEEEVSTLPRKRTPTPEICFTPGMKRGMSITSRIQNLKMEIDVLDQETDGIDFRTVLRDDAFDPAKWPWNKGRSSYMIPSPSSSHLQRQRPKSPSPMSVSTLPKDRTPTSFSPGRSLSPY